MINLNVQYYNGGFLPHHLLLIQGPIVIWFDGIIIIVYYYYIVYHYYLHNYMYGHTYSKSMIQPGKVADPARGPLNRGNGCFPVRVRESSIHVVESPCGLVVKRKFISLYQLLQYCNISLSVFVPVFSL